MRLGGGSGKGTTNGPWGHKNPKAPGYAHLQKGALPVGKPCKVGLGTAEEKYR